MPACRAPLQIVLRALLALVALATLAPLRVGAQAHGAAFKFGTTGVGLDYSYSPATLPLYALRVNLNYSGHSHARLVDDIVYRGRAEFRSLMLLADMHPYYGHFRVSAGLMWNLTRLKATAEPITETVRINGTPYPSDAVEDLGGELRTEPISPYFGIGWGTPPLGASGWFAVFDFGVLYQRGYVTLHATCGPTLPSTECADLHADLRGQEARYLRDLRDWRLYPVLTLGAGYRF